MILDPMVFGGSAGIVIDPRLELGDALDQVVPDVVVSQNVPGACKGRAALFAPGGQPAARTLTGTWPVQKNSPEADGVVPRPALVGQPSLFTIRFFWSMMPAMDREPARKVIHVDMDAFFASVEQRDDPALRGRPVAVEDIASGVTQTTRRVNGPGTSVSPERGKRLWDAR